jgi:Mitochondrial fission regulator
MSYSEVEVSQSQFLQAGGVMQRALAEKYKKGELTPPGQYVHQEFPKWIRFNPRVEEAERTTETIKGQTLRWAEKKTVYDEFVVASVAQEREVRAAHKRAKVLGIEVQSGWTVERLLEVVGLAEVGAEPAEEPETETPAADPATARIAELEAELAALKAQPAAIEIPAPLPASVNLLAASPVPAPAPEAPAPRPRRLPALPVVAPDPLVG